jgi:hypothetical protein
MPIIAATRHAASGRGNRSATEPDRVMGSVRLPLLRWLAVWRRVMSVAFAVAGWTATFAAAIASSGHLGRTGAAQIGFAATMVIFAMGEALFSPAVPVIIDGRAAPGAAGHRKRLGAFALVCGCILGVAAGGVALGAGWATTLLTTLAVACAVASIAARRWSASRHPRATASR